MNDESTDISDRTWSRNVDSINKVGYMDGASDGQTASFQSSFNSGYAQGLEFGLGLGFHKATSSLLRHDDQRKDGDIHLCDPRQINCHICLDSSTLQQNVMNLYNIQKEKNDEVANKFGNKINT